MTAGQENHTIYRMVYGLTIRDRIAKTIKLNNYDKRKIYQQAIRGHIQQPGR